MSERVAVMVRMSPELHLSVKALRTEQESMNDLCIRYITAGVEADQKKAASQLPPQPGEKQAE